MNIQKVIRRTKHKVERLYDDLNDLEKSEKWLAPFFVPNEHVRKRRLNHLKSEESYIKSKIKLLKEKISSLEQLNEADSVG